jgi:protein gp37
MGIKTDIEWCDSAINAQMGCDGCELFNPKTGQGSCYAFTLTERYKGQKGWPKQFDQPEIFEGRIEQAAKWPDLTGRERPEKSWLSSLPRLIFLNDMGDTFTEGLPLDWLRPDIPIMEASSHLWLFLTKRARRMRLFFEELGYIPQNFWLGTSVTSRQTMRRASELAQIGQEAGILGFFMKTKPFTWLSIEPLLAPVDISGLAELPNKPGWIVIGGESGPGARALELEWIRDLIRQGRSLGAAIFIKQLGSVWARQIGAGDSFKRSKGGDWTLWPEDLRIREMPPVELALTPRQMRHMADSRPAGRLPKPESRPAPTQLRLW